MGFGYRPYKFATDRRNYLWVAQFGNGTIKNLQVYDGKEWLEPESFPNDYIQCIAFDNKNTAWVGTNDGIYLLEQ